MLRFLVVAVLITLSCALRSELNDLWASFKERHGKSYTRQHDVMRRGIWESNIQRIEKHNILADRGVYTYWMGENEYTDMTIAEFRAMKNGFRASNKTSHHVQYVSESNVALPTEVDWRKEGYVTEVKNQGQCGSCWAFSTAGALEGQIFKRSKKLVSLSEQNLVDCSRKWGNQGCDGGLMTQSFQYIKDNSGIDSEESYPYIGVNQECAFKKENVAASDSGYVEIQSGNEQALQQAVVEIGPISAAMVANHDSFLNYKGGIYQEPLCNDGTLDHAILIVGYGTENGQDFWLVKNSWGTSWGEKGYFRIVRNKDNHCGIASAASYPTL
uniref:Uncharacterized protein n=1 Tax=Biomphalaria glabrata TaxID=6526 RepID=A0A2C9JEC6_BIOGL